MIDQSVIDELAAVSARQRWDEKLRAARRSREYVDAWRAIADELVGTPKNYGIVIRTNSQGMPFIKKRENMRPICGESSGDNV